MKAGLLLACLWVLLQTGCASPRTQTNFLTVFEDAQYVYCRYDAFADATYPLRSDEAEATRMRWLESWLHENHLGAKGYEVTSRNVVRNDRDRHDIFYEVRVAK